MRVSVAALLALASAVVAQDPTEGFNPITKPKEGEEVPAGSTYEIEWLPSSAHPGDIKIALLGGSSPQTLTVVDTIAEGVDASTGSYNWSVPATFGDLATYGIIVTLESDPSIFQYGFPFKIVGGDDSGDGDDGDSSSSSSSATAASTSAASTTSSDASSSTTSSDAASAPSTTSDEVEATTSSTIQTETSETVTSTSFAVPSSTSVSSPVETDTSSVTSAPPQTTFTSSVIVENPSSTTSATSTVVTGGAPSLAAGSFALFGGVAMAVLAF
ncbi:hypothetical protein VTH06DRAFT_727 [Thermothelomyces fergusii]